MMKLDILGCNGPFPAAGGATSGYLVSTEKTRIGMDLGTGTLARLTALTAPEMLDALLFSHWHFDHCSDVLPLLYRLQACGKKKLDVYGPMDAASPVRQVLEKDPSVVLHVINPGDELNIGDVQVQVTEARHPVPAVMFRLFGDGKTLCYTGDTNTVPWLETFAQGADLLLADGLFPQEIWSEEKPHLSARLTGELAKQAGVKQLVVTHLNPTIDGKTLLKEAREVFPATTMAQMGLSIRL